MTYEEIVSKVADSLGLSSRLVDKTYRAYWRAIKEHIISLPLKDDLSEEEFQNLQPNINIPSIGKLYVNPEKYKETKKHYQEFKNKQHAAHQED